MDSPETTESIIRRSVIGEIKWKARKVSPYAVKCDERFQPREKLSDPLVRDYARKMRRGERFEPILLAKVAKDGPFVLDGFHRVEAARLAEIESLDARVASMSGETATLVAIEANATHGLNLNRKDRRRCFRMFCEAERHLRPDGSVKPLRQLRAELGNIAVATTISRWLNEDGIVPSEDDDAEAVLPWSGEDEQGPDLDEFDVQLHGLENIFHRLVEEHRAAAAQRLRELTLRLVDGENRDVLILLDV